MAWKSSNGRITKEMTNGWLCKTTTGVTRFTIVIAVIVHDDHGSSTASGIQFDQWSANGRNNQQFYVINNEDQSIIITSPKSVFLQASMHLQGSKTQSATLQGAGNRSDT